MQSSSSSLENPTEPPQHRWAGIIGTLIAVLTLTVPIWAIAYFSGSGSSSRNLLQTTYPLQRVRD